MKIILKSPPTDGPNTTIDVGGKDVDLEGVYTGVGIPTDQGFFGVCQRDGGIEILLDGRLVWSSSHEAQSLTCARSERTLRTAIIDALCSQPSDEVGGRLRRGLNESREPGEHPEDRCEECREEFDDWTAPVEDWLAATGRGWGGPILCKPCFTTRLHDRERDQ